MDEMVRGYNADIRRPHRIYPWCRARARDPICFCFFKENKKKVEYVCVYVLRAREWLENVALYSDESFPPPAAAAGEKTILIVLGRLEMSQ